ncbi:MAPEG family protein [Glaciecola siphonariae]|uniref:MAPEG family protein n=1 Tax=Glaciecola siphonariae TaxID=521012 RepID=A0ABV9LQ97_9ALTE
MDSLSILHTSPLYIALLGLLFIPFTMRAGLYRLKSKIFIGTGDDPEMLRRVRGQANFIETVPIAVFILIAMEMLGASALWLHSLGIALILGRIFHYIGLTEIGPSIFRPIGMFATIVMILTGAIWILLSFV